MGAENRYDERHDLHGDGRIILTSGFKIEITVLDLSKRGARLKLETAFVLPDRFLVEIFSADRKKVKRCKASRRWQEHNLAGVQFHSAETLTISEA